MAVEENALTRAQLATSDPQAAMASLTDLEAKYGHLDHDGWLRRSIRSERAFILELNHRYQEALEELRQLAQAFVHDPHGFVTNQMAIASVLEKSGRHVDAIAELKDALSLHDRVAPAATLSVLASFARIVNAQGWDLEPQYHELVRLTLGACGIVVPAEVEHSQLKDIVLYARSMEIAAQQRYSVLVKNLNRVTGEAKTRMVDEYVANEPVGFYRELALKSFQGHA